MGLISTDDRVWELGAAIQVGSNLEEKDVVSKGLYEVSSAADDPADELTASWAILQGIYRTSWSRPTRSQSTASPGCNGR